LLEAGGPSHRSTGGTDYVMNSFAKDPLTGQYVLQTPLTRFDVPAYLNSITDPLLFSTYNWNIAGADAGKTIGGSQAHNGMLWGHPTENNVNSWGIDGWSYEEFLPYVQGVENYTNSGFPYDPTLGYTGSMHIQNVSVTFPADTEFYNLARAAGVPVNPNQNSGINGQTGISPINYNIGNDGIRQSSAQCYLAPAMARSNLVVSTFSQAARVLFSQTSGSKPTATGVTYVKTLPNGQKVKYTAKASKEVILSGGGLNSPKTLILSGIGPESQLNEFGIPHVVVNNNVGQHMRNQYLLYLTYEANNVSFPNFDNVSPQVEQYGTLGTGFYATSPGLGAYMVDLKTLPNLVDPDVFLWPGWTTADLFVKTVSFLAGATSPTYAAGTVTLASANPMVDLIFSANALPNPTDLATLVRSVKAVRSIMLQPAAVAYFGAEIVPGPAVQTDAQIETWINTNYLQAYHYMGTCKMGNTGDSAAVVDTELRVIGVNNLRVIDSSAIPGNVATVIQATATAFGLKGAALVLSAHGYSL